MPAATATAMPAGPAAEHDDFIFAVERNLARGFFDGFEGQVVGTG